MANDYLEFCTAVECRDDDELGWFREQLTTVFLPNPRKAGEDRCWDALDDVPEDQSVVEVWRFLADQPDDDEPGFRGEFDTPGRTVTFHADEAGEPDQLGRLLHRFVARFRPEEHLAFTWAIVSDRSVDGGFDGGALVATANGWSATTGSDWADRRARIIRLSKGDPWSEHAEHPRSDWSTEVAAHDTQLGYWDWVLERLDAPCDCEQPGPTNCGVPGVLAWTEDGHVVPGAEVERCDACERFPDDESDREELRRRDLLPPPVEGPSTYPITVVLSDERGIDVDSATCDSAAEVVEFIARTALNHVVGPVPPRPATVRLYPGEHRGDE